MLSLNRINHLKNILKQIIISLHSNICIKYKLILYHNGKGLTEQCTGTLFIGDQKIKIKMNCNSFNEDPYLSQPAYKGKIHILDLVYYVALWKKSYLKQDINEIYYNGNITG